MGSKWWDASPDAREKEKWFDVDKHVEDNYYRYVGVLPRTAEQQARQFLVHTFRAIQQHIPTILTPFDEQLQALESERNRFVQEIEVQEKSVDPSRTAGGARETLIGLVEERRATIAGLKREWSMRLWGTLLAMGWILLGTCCFVVETLLLVAIFVLLLGQEPMMLYSSWAMALTLSIGYVILVEFTVSQFNSSKEWPWQRVLGAVFTILLSLGFTALRLRVISTGADRWMAIIQGVGFPIAALAAGWCWNRMLKALDSRPKRDSAMEKKLDETEAAIEAAKATIEHHTRLAQKRRRYLSFRRRAVAQIQRKKGKVAHRAMRVLKRKLRHEALRLANRLLQIEDKKGGSANQ
jgi:hypothetical protein